MFDVNRNRNRISAVVWTAYNALKAAGHRPRICSPHHLKIGRYNFYPRTGTILCDEEVARPERGLAAFVDLLAAERPESAGAAASLKYSPTPTEAAATGLSLCLPEQT